MMERDELDLLVVYGDDHALFGNANVRYVSDFPTHFEPALVLLAPGEDPVLATGPETIEHARLVSRTRDVEAISEFGVPILEYPGLSMPSLREYVRASFPTRTFARVGVVGFDLMSVGHWDVLRPAFGEAEIARLDDYLFELRPYKSEEEVAVLRHAFTIAERAFAALLEACVPGAREFEVAAAAEGTARALGAEGNAIDTMVAANEYSAPIIGRTGTRELRPGDHVGVTFAPKFRGYGAPIGRLLYLGGDPPDHIAEAGEVARVAQERAAATLRDGATYAEVDAAARTYLREHGYDSAYGIGHSCGVQEFEPPYFGPEAAGAMATRHVMSIDIGIYGLPWGGFRTEDAFVVTENGSEPTTSVQRGLIALG